MKNNNIGDWFDKQTIMPPPLPTELDNFIGHTGRAVNEYLEAMQQPDNDYEPMIKIEFAGAQIEIPLTADHYDAFETFLNELREIQNI